MSKNERTERGSIAPNCHDRCRKLKISSVVLGAARLWSNRPGTEQEYVRAFEPFRGGGYGFRRISYGFF
jgi:hypothetical protein